MRTDFLLLTTLALVSSPAQIFAEDAAARPAAEAVVLPAAARSMIEAGSLRATKVSIWAQWIDDVEVGHRTAENPTGSNGTNGLETESRAVFAYRPDRPMIPASTAKLFSTGCALDELGPAYRFTTRFAASSEIQPSGALEGSLYIHGGGHPQLRGEDLFGAAAELRSLGLTRIGGDLVLDDSWLGQSTTPAGWPASRSSRPYNAAQGSLSVAWNSVQLVLRDASNGQPPQAELFPLEGLAQLDVQVSVGAKTKIDVKVVEPGGDRLTTLRVRGTLARGDTFRRWYRLGDPALSVGHALKALFSSKGITIEGRVRRGATPGGVVTLVEHRSRPLAQIVADINKYSSNFGAELLMRVVSAERDGPGASVARGVDALRGCIDREAEFDGAVRLEDGSGYSRNNRVTARALVEWLAAAQQDPSWAPEFLASLPVAGVDGSLENRLRGFRGRLRAKTGTLSRVATLAGFYDAPDGRRLVFAVLLNTPEEAPARGAPDLDQLVASLLENL